MTKAYPHITQGTGYIRLSRLPFDQALKLKKWVSDCSFVKVKSENQLLEDCIQFSEYEYWFDCFYSESKMQPDFGI